MGGLLMVVGRATTMSKRLILFDFTGVVTNGATAELTIGTIRRGKAPWPFNDDFGALRERVGRCLSDGKEAAR